jgi:MazG family protein
MESFSKLNDLLKSLRAEDGCPWDKKQTLESLRSGFLEEVYELLETIDQKDFPHFKEELGDVFFNLLFFAELARDAGQFNLEEVLASACEKIIRRHPHVFARKPGEAPMTSEEKLLRQWEKIKAIERAGAPSEKKSLLSGIPKGLPSLLKAERLQAKAAHVGFDWPKKEPVFLKIKEELAELEKEVEEKNHPNMEEELGDLLFTIVNAARHLNVNPDKALQLANDKFQNRFRVMEELLHQKNLKTDEMNLDKWDELWDRAKATLKK